MITLTDNLKTRVSTERAKPGQAGVRLRVTVDSGGCAGFEYKFAWDSAAPKPDDAVYDDLVVIDEVSLSFMPDATIDFVQTLMGSDFKVTNPQATSGCGCGHSFAV
jgi:iron-sulfur cluster insertion protein